MSVRLGEKNFTEEVKESSQLYIVDFYSDSCVPCKRLSPILYQIEEEYQGRLSVGKVNVAFENGLTEEYQVVSAPTVVFFQNGVEVERLTGLISKEQLEEKIKKYIG
jgi:thioredoxin 1